MDQLGIILGSAGGLIIGALLVFFYMKSKSATLLAEKSLWEKEQEKIKEEREKYQQKLAELQRVSATNDMLNSQLKELNAEVEKQKGQVQALVHESAKHKQEAAVITQSLENERRQFQEKEVLLQKSEERLSNTFKALSAEALHQNQSTFVAMAKETLEKYQTKASADLAGRQEAIGALVSPLKKSLETVQHHIHEVEKTRSADQAGLKSQIETLMMAQGQLQKETGNLVNALRNTGTRGRWGEIQLKRVAEMAGMVAHCDFSEQTSVTTEDDNRLRPDMIVKLPNNRMVVVDAKAPLQAYLDSLEETDEALRKRHLIKHAQQIKTHINNLSKKNYWDQFEQSPEFVVLFLPGEVYFSAALQQDPGLIEAGVKQKVILATPTTLIALLQAVAFGWRQEQMAENARKISKEGKDLFDRIRIFVEHFSKVGAQLGKSVTFYNKAASSLEKRLLVTSSRLRELGASKGEDEIAVPPALTQLPSPISESPFLTLDSESKS